jgi:type I restriction enzyme M protein
MLCVTNLMLHGIEVPSNIRHDNTLARPLRDYGRRPRGRGAHQPALRRHGRDGIEQGFPADVRTKETADLFLVLIKHILKDGGRAALVLPDGTLFGEGVKTRIKEQLLAECNLHTIVRLPNGVFAPYTGIKTNLLFFTKGTPTKDVWYYEHPYPPGVKNYNKTKPIRIEEFDAEKGLVGQRGRWLCSRVENERAWKVSIDAIRAANYNLDQKQAGQAAGGDCGGRDSRLICRRGGNGCGSATPRSTATVSAIQCHRQTAITARKFTTTTALLASSTKSTAISLTRPYS